MVTVVINCSIIFFPQQALTGKSNSARREGVLLCEIESEAQEAVEDEPHILLIWVDPVCDFSSPSFAWKIQIMWAWFCFWNRCWYLLQTTCDSDQFEKQQVGSLQGNGLLWAVWYHCPHDARSSDSAASRWHRQLWVSARALYLRDWAFSDLSEFSLSVLAKGRYGFYWFACSKNRYYGLVHDTSLGQTAIQIFFKKIKNWVFLFLFLPLRSKYFWGRCSSLTQKKNSLFVAILEKKDFYDVNIHYGTNMVNFILTCSWAWVSGSSVTEICWDSPFIWLLPPLFLKNSFETNSHTIPPIHLKCIFQWYLFQISNDMKPFPQSIALTSIPPSSIPAPSSKQPILQFLSLQSSL